MKKVTLKIVDIDTGFCRITYKAETESGGYVFYCLQDEGERWGGVILYRSTREFEPEYPVTKIKPEFKLIFEEPEGDYPLAVKCREFISNFELTH